ncbi:MAG: type IV secretory system conjugative DNA transfer family protein [Patescibacteria group bacterium]
MELTPTFNFDFSVENLLTDPTAIVIILALAAICGLIVLLFILRMFFRKRGRLSTAFKKDILLVTLPKYTEKEESGPVNVQQIQEKIGVMESVFSAVGGLKAQKGWGAWFFGREDHLAFEMVADEGKISFYLAVPEYLKAFVIEQVQAQFPSANIEDIEDYNIFTPKAVIAGKMLTFKRQNFFPIKTYKKMDSDPLNALANALAKVDEKDGAVIQFVVRSARASWRDQGIGVASRMTQGKKLDEALKGKSVMKQMFKRPPKTTDGAPKPEEHYQLSPMEQEFVKGIEEKASKAGMDVNIRVLAASDQSQRTEMYLNDIVNSFSQYNIYQYGNSFSLSSVKLSKLIDDYIYRHFDEKRAIVVNAEEMASLFHFPIPSITETPNINWLGSKKAPAPLNTPREGTLLGINEYRGKRTEIRIKRDDRRRHMYIIGMTGVGKSWLSEGIAMQDIVNGEGVCFIDPHGDAINHILERIPKERADDVVILDPSDVERPIGLNLLEFKTEQEKTFAINEIMAIFDKLYDLKATGGPMFEQYFKNAAALIMADPNSGSTLLEISRVLADEDFRAYKLSKCKNQVVKDFWEKEAQKAGGEASLANMVPYITSKMAPFISNEYVRPIISQQDSTIDFANIMNTRKILLVKLSKGKIGEINANLLGMIVIGKLLMAALARGDMPEEERADFYLYVDEFQNFLTDSMEIILSEARKYRLCLTIGHQYIGQLIKHGDTKFKDAIFGNVGTKIAFRIGVDDAESLAKEFEPVFNEQDFLNIPKFNTYVKLLIDNANPPGFNMATLPFDEIPSISPANPQLVKMIVKLSRLKYGKDRDIVEAEILERTKVSY